MIDEREYKIVFLHKREGFFAQIWDDNSIVEQYDNEMDFLDRIKQLFNGFIQDVFKF